MCKQWMAFCLGAAFTASGGELLPTTAVDSSVVLSSPDDDSCESKHLAITMVKSDYLLYLFC
jgi:hypothetical protein